MQNLEDSKSQLAAFSKAYDYDASYIAGLAASSLGAYAAFAAAQPLGSYRSVLPLEAHFVAGISTQLTEGCGACAQLGLKRAVQEGVSRDLLRTLLETPEKLEGPLADVHAHAKSVCQGGPDDYEREERLRAAYGDAGVAEIAVCIAGCRLYPTMKRALFKMSVCAKPSLEF
jgi:hypothetical protein